MARLAVPGIFGLVMFLLWVWCVFDVIATDSALCRNLPKTAWLLLVIVVPTVGGVAWLALGRPANAGFRPGDTTYRSGAGLGRRSQGPEDDPSFRRSMYAPASGAPSPGSLESERRAIDNAEADRRLDEWEESRRRTGGPEPLA